MNVVLTFLPVPYFVPVMVAWQERETSAAWTKVAAMQPMYPETKSKYFSGYFSRVVSRWPVSHFGERV